MKKLWIFALLCLTGMAAFAQKPATVASPDGRNVVSVTFGEKLSYSVTSDGQQVIVQTPISMTLSDGTVWGDRSRLSKRSIKNVQTKIAAFAYTKQEVEDHYNQLLLEFTEGFAVEFRTYNDAVSYRFLSTREKPLTVKDEYAAFPFAGDDKAWASYVKLKDPDKIPAIELQFHNSFENDYTYGKISDFDARRLIFTPIAVEMASGKRVVIAESDLESYPGMFLRYDREAGGFKSAFAPYVRSEAPSGQGVRKFNRIPTEREDFIARTQGKRSFPWRIVIIANSDRELLDNDAVYRLAAPSRIGDTGWIKPGKVAWDWWNDWGITGVDFKAGVNTRTYKYYIDFASKNRIEYVVLDEGWSRPDNADLMDVVPEIDLKEIIRYARSKDVGIVLWASYNSMNKDYMEDVCRHYAGMGVAGFKVDFMDRDDCGMVEFLYKLNALAARYQLVLDYHGMYKPTGMNRTWPNVLSFEGVRGTEYFKWSDPKGYDQITYDVAIPYLRQLAGPMDYTPGGMRNVPAKNYYPSRSLPLVQGTRCRQLAMYILYYSPIAMLCDSPSAYNKEKPCLDFITPIPTVWDQTVAVDGKIGDFAIMARRKGDVWYVAGLTGHSERTFDLEMPWLPAGKYSVELFTDGANAEKIATDYKRKVVPYETGKKLTIKMIAGGGFAARVVLSP